MRPVPQQCVDLVMRWEGFSPTIYACSGGYLTVGFGYVLRDQNGKMLTYKDPTPVIEPWTKEKAERTLRERDLPVYSAAVVRLCGADLNDNQHAALTSFAYNLGTGSLRASTLRKKVLAGEHQAAAEQFGRWVFAGGKRLRGLERRRAAEAALYLQ